VVGKEINMDDSGRNGQARGISSSQLVAEGRRATVRLPSHQQDSDTRPDLHGRRPDVLGLAVTIGLVVFLVAESVPGGLAGARAFFLGTGVAIIVVAGLTTLAAVVERGRRGSSTPVAELTALANTEVPGLEDAALRRLAGQLALLYVDLPTDASGRLADLLRLWAVIDPESRELRLLRLANEAVDDQAAAAAIVSRLEHASPAQLALLAELIKGGPNGDR
jgi:hypothetical protein